MGALGMRGFSFFLLLIYSWTYGGLAQATEPLKDRLTRDKASILQTLRTALDSEGLESWKGPEGIQRFRGKLRSTLQPRLDAENAKIDQLDAAGVDALYNRIEGMKQRAYASDSEALTVLFEKWERKPLRDPRDQAKALNQLFFNRTIQEIDQSLKGAYSVHAWLENAVAELSAKQGEPGSNEAPVQEEPGWNGFEWICMGLVVGAVAVLMLHGIGIVSWGLASVAWGVLSIFLVPAIVILYVGAYSVVKYTVASDSPLWDGKIPEEEADKKIRKNASNETPVSPVKLK